MLQLVLGRTSRLFSFDTTRAARKTKTSEGDTQTHRQQGDLISFFLYFKNKENRLK
jgi:hypothetical protein